MNLKIGKYGKYTVNLVDIAYLTPFDVSDCFPITNLCGMSHSFSKEGSDYVH